MPELAFEQHRIHYLDVGDGDAAPMVLLHNGGMCHRVWQPQIEYFSLERRVVAPDMLGFGESDKPRLDYDLDVYVRQLEALIGELDLPPAVLVGNCIGAATVLRLAALKPERAAAVVALNVDTDRTLEGGNFGPALWMTRHGMGWAVGWASRTLRPPQRFVQRGASRQFLGTPDPAFLAYVEECYRDPAQLRVLGSIVQNMSSYALTPVEAGEGRPPTCLVWGEQNDVLPLAGMSLVRDAIQPDETHVIARASHLAARERPDEFNAIVEGFLERHT